MANYNYHGKKRVIKRKLPSMPTSYRIVYVEPPHNPSTGSPTIPHDMYISPLCKLYIHTGISAWWRLRHFWGINRGKDISCRGISMFTRRGRWKGLWPDSCVQSSWEVFKMGGRWGVDGDIGVFSTPRTLPNTGLGSINNNSNERTTKTCNFWMKNC